MTYFPDTQRTSQKGVVNGYASLDANAKVPIAELGDSSANNTNHLRGDLDWKPAGLAAPLQVTTKNVLDSPYSVSVSDCVILIDCTSGDFQAFLPDASGNAGKVYILKKIDNSDNSVYYYGAGTDTIDGDASRNLPLRYDAISIVSDSISSDWHIIGVVPAWINVPGGNLNSARRSFGAFGTNSAGVACGGRNGPFASTETFNDVAWTLLGAGGDLNTARWGFMAFGIQSAGVVCGGLDSTNTVIATTETFNGATWSALGGGDLNAVKGAAGEFGTSSAGVICGGTGADSVSVAITETFNGLTWTDLGAGGNLNTARQGAGTFGIQSAGVTCAGIGTSGNIASTEIFNGSVWTALGASGDLSVALSGARAFGIQSAGVNCGQGSPVTGMTEIFNGSTWTLLGASGYLNTARFAFSAFGVYSDGIACGGFNSVFSIIGTTEKFS